MTCELTDLVKKQLYKMGFYTDFVLKKMHAVPEFNRMITEFVDKRVKYLNLCNSLSLH